MSTPCHYTVRAPGTAAVSYPTRGQARRVARQVRGARVSGPPWLLVLLLRLEDLAAAWRSR